MPRKILRLLLVATLAVLATACASRPVQQPVTTTAEHATRDGLVPLVSRGTPDGELVAVWMGKDPGVGVGPESPIGLWIQEIQFYFGSDKEPLRYPTQFDPDSSTFEIFSPDGAYVALSRGRGAPFHIVQVSLLRAYLKDGTTPHEIVSGLRQPNDPAASVHHPRWTTDRIFELDAMRDGRWWHVSHLVGGPTELGPDQDAHE